jgi:hypothetical protein
MVGGGLAVGVDVIIVSVEAVGEVDLTLTGSIGFVDPYDDGWVTFGDIKWMVALNDGNLWGSMQKQLDLAMGLRFYVQICLDLLFVKWCLTVLSIQPPAITLWQETFAPKLIPEVVSDSGCIDLDVVADYNSLLLLSLLEGGVTTAAVGTTSTDGGGDHNAELLRLSTTTAALPCDREFLIYQSTNGNGAVFDYYPETSSSSLSSSSVASPAGRTLVPSNNEVTYTGSATLQFCYHVQGNSYLVFTPPAATLQLDMDTFNASLFVMTSTGVVPQGCVHRAGGRTGHRARQDRQADRPNGRVRIARQRTRVWDTCSLARVCCRLLYIRACFTSTFGLFASSSLQRQPARPSCGFSHQLSPTSIVLPSSSY